MWKNYKKKYILLGRAAKDLRKGNKIFEFKDEQKFIKQGMSYMLEKNNTGQCTERQKMSSIFRKW